jgi:hypothetical protein
MTLGTTPAMTTSPPDIMESLAHAGAANRAPLQWHFIETLKRRIDTTSGAVQARLQRRLDQELEALGKRLSAQTDARADSLSHQQGTPLTALLADMGAATPAPAAVALPRTAAARAMPTPRPELKSVGRMRKTLSRLKVKQQVSQALAQPPQHAGPIHSQRLVLRSLALMQEISADYLHRFMSHVDALMTLEDAQRLPTSAVIKGKKRPS